MNRLLVILAAAALTAAPAAAAATHVAGPPATAARLTSAAGISAAAAGQDAVAAVGGGVVSHTSSDTYQGQPIWDVHVLYNSQSWDVKVSMSGTILLKRLASEQPSGSTTPSAPAISASQADAIAVKAVGGGTVTHTSTDHAAGVPVYDIHVTYQNQVWDVKVNQATGAVVQKKLSSEQPSGSGTPPSAPAISASQADAIAVKAVGGGTATHTSTDHAAGVPVYDIHVIYQNQVWDVKVNQATGAVVQKKLSSEQPGSSQGSGQSSDHSKEAPQKPESSQHATASTPPAGVVFGQKMTTPPAAYSAYVSAAIAKVSGVSLKWVKFQSKSHGDFQMNIKIHLAHGTTKVIDVFSASGQLLRQKISG